MSEPKLKAGSPAPDFEFTLTRGNIMSLSNIIARGPVLVNFIKSPWCSQHANYMRNLRRWQSSLGRKNVTLLVISAQKIEVLREWTKTTTIDFLFGAVTDAETYQKFGVPLDNPTEGFVKPTTFLIDTDMTVRLAWEDVKAAS